MTTHLDVGYVDYASVPTGANRLKRTVCLGAMATFSLFNMTIATVQVEEEISTIEMEQERIIDLAVHFKYVPDRTGYDHTILDVTAEEWADEVYTPFELTDERKKKFISFLTDHCNDEFQDHANTWFPFNSFV